MAKFKPYERYKDSGVEWIGEIPEHWNLKPLKSLLMDGKDGVKIGPFGSSLKLEEFDEGFPYKVYGQENIINDDFSAGSRFISQEKYAGMEVYKLKPGDIIISMMGTIGRCKVVPLGVNPGIMDSHLIRIRVSKNFLSPEFLQYVIDESNYIKEQFFVSSTGSIMSGLNSSIVKNVFVITPSIPEQQAIADFLDQKTSEIDGLVADKEKLVSLLQEYRQAIISEAVTKGLNPDVKMKDSGVEWIGEIPEHWEVSKIKYTVSINRNVLSEDTNDDYEMDYIDIGSVNSSGKIINVQRLDFLSAPSRARRIISPGDSIVSTVRTYLKAIAFFDEIQENLICSTGFAVLSPVAIHPKYFFRLVHSEPYVHEIVRRSTGVSYPAINASEIGQLYCLIPSGEEQQAIADYLDRKTAEIDDLISGIQESIHQLKSYRQSLISEAVTGKIDVRGVI